MADKKGRERRGRKTKRANTNNFQLRALFVESQRHRKRKESCFQKQIHDGRDKGSNGIIIG